MGSGFSIKYLRGNDPGEGATAHGEGELENPSEHEENPEKAHLRRWADVVEFRDYGGRNNETDRADQIPNDQGPTSSDAVDEENGA